MPDLSPEPQILTRKTALEAKQRRDAGHLLKLEHTGGYARVRIPSLVDHAFLNQLPSSVQQIVSEQLANESLAVRKQKQDKVAAMTANERFAYFLELAQAQDELAKRSMVLCWVEPRVVLSQDELPEDGDNVILADDIHIEDRVTWVNLVFMEEKEAVAEMERFRREPVGAVSAQPHVEAPAAAQSPAEHAGAVQS